MKSVITQIYLESGPGEELVESSHSVVGGGIAVGVVPGFTIAHVMVAEAEAVGNLSVEGRHRLSGNFPFFVIVGLGDVALVQDEGDIQLLGVVPDPFSLSEEVLPEVDLVPLFGGLGMAGVTIALGVRKDDQGKRGVVTPLAGD